MHACSSSYTRQQNERLVHARVQFPMVIRHRSVVRTPKMLCAFLKTCRAVQLLHACVVKFKVSGTVCIYMLATLTFIIETQPHTVHNWIYKNQPYCHILFQETRPSEVVWLIRPWPHHFYPLNVNNNNFIMAAN